MINIVYIDNELLFSQEFCDDFCGKHVNRARQKDRRIYVTNTARIANLNHGGYTAQLMVGRVLGEVDLELAEETQFMVHGNAYVDGQIIGPIASIIKDAGFDVTHARGCMYDEVYNFTSFVFPSAGRLNDFVSKSDTWKNMPVAHESWEKFKC